MSLTLTPENQLVIAACTTAPDLIQLKDTILRIDNWDKASKKLIKKGVAPLFLDILERNPELFSYIPPDTTATLKQAFFKTVSRSLVMYDTFRDIAIALNVNKIKSVALKGVYLAEHIYPKIGMRQFSDIDLLFRKEDVDTALKVFYALGFRMDSPVFDELVRSVQEPAHLPHLIRNGISVELHTRLHGPFNEYKLNEKDFFDRAIPIEINHQPFYVFDKQDLIIHLCIHLDKHINGSNVQFYSFADIGRLMSSINVNELIERCDKYEAKNTVVRILTLLNMVFNAPIPAEIKQGSTNEVSPVILNRLVMHLDDRIEDKLATKTHLQYLKRFDTAKDKLNYIISVSFPSKDYMKKAYKISNINFYWMWYPIRWWKGILGLFSRNGLRDN